MWSFLLEVSSWLGQDSEEKKCSLNGLNEVYVTDMAKQLNALSTANQSMVIRENSRQNKGYCKASSKCFEIYMITCA